MKFLRRARLRTVLGSALVLLFFAVPAFTAEFPPGLNEKWRHFRSPHFELYSRVGEGSSRLLLYRLEVLRSFLLHTSKLVERTPMPVTIYYFNRESDFQAYRSEADRKNRTIAGVYQAGADRGVYFLREVNDGSRTPAGVAGMLYHFMQTSGDRGPLWYSAGLSQLFGTMEVGENNLIFGKANDARVQHLGRNRFMKLERLFAVDHGSDIMRNAEQSQLFFSHAWVLMHYFYLGEHPDIPMMAVNDFLNYARARGAAMEADDLRQAFERTFGFGYEAMNERLDRYISGGRYRFSKEPLPQVDAPASYSQRAVAGAEMQDRLAELLLRTQRDPRAKLHLLGRLEQPGADRVRLLEVLGAASKGEGDPDQTRARWQQAIAEGSTNPEVLRASTVTELTARFRQFDPYYRLPAEDAEKLRGWIARIIAEVPTQTAAYEWLALVESAAPVPSVPNVNLVQKHFDVIDGKEATLLALALVRHRLDDLEGAKRMLAILEETMPGPSLAQKIELVRAKIEGRPPVHLAVPAKPRAPVRVVPAAPLRLGP